MTWLKQWEYMGVEPRIGIPQNGCFIFHGKPYEQMDDLGVALFLETPIFPTKKEWIISGIRREGQFVIGCNS